MPRPQIIKPPAPRKPLAKGTSRYDPAIVLNATGASEDALPQPDVEPSED